MAKVLINKSARAVIAGGTLFSPNVPVSVNVEELKKTYPAIGEMIEAGELVVADEDEAKKIKAKEVAEKAEKEKEEKALEEQTLDELKAYAAKHNISIEGLKKRGDVIAVLKEAMNRA